MVLLSPLGLLLFLLLVVASAVPVVAADGGVMGGVVVRGGVGVTKVGLLPESRLFCALRQAGRTCH